MENPLKKYFPVEERPDGVYITVARENRGAVSIPEIRAQLDAASVINYDLERIREVVSRARGLAERVGPLFQYFDSSLLQYVSVRVTEMKAVLRVSGTCVSDGVRVTVEAVLYLLQRKGVVHGILREEIERVLEDGVYDEDVVVAQGKAPVDGTDASIAFEVELNPDTKPLLRADGGVDYRQIKSFVQVGNGQVLARKVPPTEGEPGMSVVGKTLAPTPGNDVPFPAGANTYISQDGKCLMASKAGVIKREGTLVCVREILTVKKDVDFSVGNVKYGGDLIINGDVKPGFTIEAEGNITINGAVESSQVISRNGWVTIGHGVIGKGDTTIYGKTGIQVTFAQEARLETDGTLTVLKHCLHCDCQCAVFDATDRQSTVVGGEIKVTGHAEIHQAGNDQGIETRIVVIDKNKIVAEEKVVELESLKKKLTEKLEPIKKQVQTKAAIMKKAGNVVTDRQRSEMKKWIDEYNAINMKIKYVQQKIAEAHKVILEPTDQGGYVKADTLLPGVVITLYETHKVVRERMLNKCFKMGTQESEEQD